MPKKFDSARITPNDDGTFSVSICPVPKKQEGKDGGMSVGYERDKTYSAATLEDAIGKISGFSGNGDGPADMEDFLNPRRGKQDSEDETETTNPEEGE